MQQDYLVRANPPEFTNDDLVAVENARGSQAFDALLKFCIGNIQLIEKAVFDANRKVPLTEAQTNGFIQAREAYIRVFDFITNPPLPEDDNE